MLTIDTIPLYGTPASCRHRRQDGGVPLFILSVQPMAAAATAELLELQATGRVLFVLCRHVITLFALCALQNYVISRHTSSVASCRLPVVSSFPATDN